MYFPASDANDTFGMPNLPAWLLRLFADVGNFAKLKHSLQAKSLVGRSDNNIT